MELRLISIYLGAFLSFAIHLQLNAAPVSAARVSINPNLKEILRDEKLVGESLHASDRRWLLEIAKKSGSDLFSRDDKKVGQTVKDSWADGPRVTGISIVGQRLDFYLEEQSYTWSMTWDGDTKYIPLFLLQTAASRTDWLLVLNKSVPQNQKMQRLFWIGQKGRAEKMTELTAAEVLRGLRDRWEIKDIELLDGFEAWFKEIPPGALREAILKSVYDLTGILENIRTKNGSLLDQDGNIRQVNADSEAQHGGLINPEILLQQLQIAARPLIYSQGKDEKILALLMTGLNDFAAQKAQAFDGREIVLPPEAVQDLQFGPDVGRPPALPVPVEGVIVAPKSE